MSRNWSEEMSQRHGFFRQSFFYTVSILKRQYRLQRDTCNRIIVHFNNYSTGGILYLEYKYFANHCIKFFVKYSQLYLCCAVVVIVILDSIHETPPLPPPNHLLRHYVSLRHRSTIPMGCAIMRAQIIS